MKPDVDVDAFTRRNFFSRYDMGGIRYTSSYFIRLDKDQLDRAIASHLFDEDRREYANSVGRLLWRSSID